MSPPIIDRIGQRFGSNVVIARVGSNETRGSRFLVRCDCGVESIALIANLIKSASRFDPANGCYHQRVSPEKRAYPAEFGVWNSMRARCLNPNHHAYASYGGRGITICERWLKFANFIADMGRRPSPQHSIDRINGDGNYEPQNCRWATPIEQQNNKSNVNRVEYRGQTMTIRDAVDLAGNIVSQEIAHGRIISRGWDVARAVETPIRRIYHPDGTWRHSCC